ncbi:hypothetical protein [Streptomyces sp. NPDC048172]|uniref:hypothetical protein n=1 Tax=Streptomyces sp. NPDC048172 TaxID=3365505 RepID=UPI00371E5B78
MMRTRTRIAAAAATLLTAGMLAVGTAGSAQAADAQPTRAAGTVSVAEEGEFYGDYWNRNDCENTGQWLKNTGQYGHYVCEKDWLSGDWNLYVYN